jgi:hypothetical protein
MGGLYGAAAAQAAPAASAGALAVALVGLVIAVLVIKVLLFPETWLILVPLAAGGFWVRHQVMSRRRAAALERYQRWLHYHSCLPAADAMSGP